MTLELQRVLEDVAREYARQIVLKAEGRFEHTAEDDELSNPDRFTIIGEEFGEVARECLTQPGAAIANDTQGSPERLRKELIQVAAIAVAWVKGLDQREKES